MKPPPAHRATTANLQAIYPFVSEGGLEHGPLIGRDLFGGPFCFDPWELYRRGVVTNPNLLVLGQIGRGKSTFVKTFVWRQLAFGRKAWVVDPKGEYGPLAEACGATALRLAPGGHLRLNPLEYPASTTPGPLGPTPAPPGTRLGQSADPDSAVDATLRWRADLTCSIVASSFGRRLTSIERTAVELAVRAASRARHQPALPDVVAALLDPPADLAATVRTDAVGLAGDGRLVALELRRLAEGDLRGMFDGPTSSGLDLEGPMVVIDLSAVFVSPALPMLMTCATAWLQTTLARNEGSKRLVIIDEAWAILRDSATTRWLQATFKLSRAFGVANLAVVHRLSDLRSAGADGSSEQKLAEGLLADSETRVVFGQPPSEAELTAGLLGLSDSEKGLLVQLPRGVALWKVGERSFLVEHAVGRDEVALVDTDAAMSGRRGP